MTSSRGSLQGDPGGLVNKDRSESVPDRAIGYRFEKIAGERDRRSARRRVRGSTVQVEPPRRLVADGAGPGRENDPLTVRRNRRQLKGTSLQRSREVGKFGGARGRLSRPAGDDRRRRGPPRAPRFRPPCTLVVDNPN